MTEDRRRTRDQEVAHGQQWDRMTDAERLAHIKALIRLGARSVVAYKVRWLLAFKGEQL